MTLNTQLKLVERLNGIHQEFKADDIQLGEFKARVNLALRAYKLETRAAKELPRRLYENINNNFDFSVNTWNSITRQEKLSKIRLKRAEYAKRHAAEMEELVDLEYTL